MKITASYLIEQAQLEDIARERVYEFLLVCVTPKFAGATGSRCAC